MTPKHLIVLSCIALTLSGCGLRERIFGTTGTADRALPYRTSLARGEDRRNITVRVRARNAGVAQVRESVRFQATRYCLANFGGSDTRWTLDARTGDWAFSHDGDEMVFTGRCVAR